MWRMPAPASVPLVSSSDSPGRKGATTSPVSAKIVAKMASVDPRAELLDQLGQVDVQVQDVLEELVDVPGLRSRRRRSLGSGRRLGRSASPPARRLRLRGLLLARYSRRALYTVW